MNYIKEMIHNKDHPENHSVRYIKKIPTFQNTIKRMIKESMNVRNSKIVVNYYQEPVLEVKEKITSV
jgi:hypothetical protein